MLFTFEQASVGTTGTTGTTRLFSEISRRNGFQLSSDLRRWGAKFSLRPPVVPVVPVVP